MDRRGTDVVRHQEEVHLPQEDVRLLREAVHPGARQTAAEAIALLEETLPLQGIAHPGLLLQMAVVQTAVPAVATVAALEEVAVQGQEEAQDNQVYH